MVKHLLSLCAFVVFGFCGLWAQPSWVTVDSVGSTLYDVWATDGVTAYTVGMSGKIVKTTDVGVTWNPLTSGTNYTLYGVHFPGPTTGVAVGLAGRIVRTTDAGATWSSINSGTTVTLTDVHFADLTNGYASGDSGTILRSTDAGLTWAVQSSGYNSKLECIYSLSSTNAYAAGYNGLILHTTDGATWTMQPSTISNRIDDIRFVDANVGVSVGQFTDVLRTTDGGDYWTNLSPWGLATFMYALDHESGSTWYSVGPTGYTYQSTNTGASWVRLNTNTLADLYGVSFPNATTGYAVGANGVILKIDIPVSTTNPSENFGFTIYPVPAQTSLYVNLEHKGNWKTTQAQITDLNGRILKTATLNPAENAIDIEKLCAGTYFLKLSNVDGAAVRKFVVVD